MDKKLIFDMINSKSLENLDQIIKERILKEKEEYENKFQAIKTNAVVNSGNTTKNKIYLPENDKTYSKYIVPPRSENDFTIRAYDFFLDPNDVSITISNGWPTYSYYFDDEKEIYENLAFELSKESNPYDTEKVINSISRAVFEYIGGAKVQGNDFDRLALLKPDYELDDNEKNRISNFKGSKKAWCVERACLAHQLFKFLGIDSKIIMSTISNNGENQIHSFNLIKLDNKSIIFDCSVMNPPDNNNEYNPIAYTLPPEVYDNNLTNIENLPIREITGLSGRQYKIIYDLQNRINNERAINF